MPRVELLWWDGCPSHAQALEDLRASMAELGLDPDAVELVQIEGETDALAQGFSGSPTIRVDGQDVLPPPDGHPVGLTCRVYRLRDGRPSPTPDPEDLRAALARVVTERT